MKHVALVYNPHIATARALAQQISSDLAGQGDEVRMFSAWEPATEANWHGLDLAVTFGGDGTIVRTARLAAPRSIPIVGINLGRLGFLAELKPSDARQQLPGYLNNHCWTEERLMLQIGIDVGGNVGWPGSNQAPPVTRTGPFLALNEAAIGRGRNMRVVRLIMRVDGQVMADYYADGVLVATPTGSTAYSLSAGGPVLHPEMDNLLVTPLLPHLTAFRSVVLPSSVPVEVEVHTDHEATLSIDGQIDLPLRDGARVSVSAAEHRCRFLRAGPRQYFYQTLSQRLRLRGE